MCIIEGKFFIVPEKKLITHGLGCNLDFKDSIKKKPGGTMVQ